VRVLVTGTAGFIGSHVAIKLLARGDDVVGVDNMNAYYDVNLKEARLARVQKAGNYTHIKADLADRRAIEEVFRDHKPQRVVNLAAQAGVRYAAENPHVYIDSNVTGFLHILEGCRHNGVEHLIYASTSSVYGANQALPFSEKASTEHPLTLYAATKKSNEMMAHSYAHLYGLPATGLRFFTVYGPWGRPDMALFLFTKAILAGEPIKVFNHGKHTRDFTYIDDIAEGVVRALDKVPAGDASWDGMDPNPATSRAPYRIYNIGNQRQVELTRYIEVLEQCLGRNTPVARDMQPLQQGDVPDTRADVSALASDVGYRPSTPIEVGVKNFVDWYLDYYR
jgi:UDP-glucuronate 4-epimerase